MLEENLPKAIPSKVDVNIRRNSSFDEIIDLNGIEDFSKIICHI